MTSLRCETQEATLSLLFLLLKLHLETCKDLTRCLLVVFFFKDGLKFLLYYLALETNLSFPEFKAQNTNILYLATDYKVPYVWHAGEEGNLA